MDVSVALGTSFTISGWIYPDSPTNSYSCIAANTTNLAFCLRGSDAGGDSGLLTYYYSGVDHQSTTALSFNQWHYVSLVNDNGNVTFYVDGQKNGTAASGPSITVEYLGATDNAGEYFKGSLDTIRLYDYARTAAQIAWEYNQGGPIAWYKFDECSGATANNSAPAADGDAGLDGTIFAGDSSGTNDSVGSCDSGASSPTDEMWDEGTTGKINASLDFDNTNDYVQISDDAALDFVDGESFTITAWVKASTLSDNNAIVSKKNGVGTSSVGYMLYVNTSGQLGTYISESATDNVNLFTDTTIAAGSWYHVALVYDDDTDLNIYINGLDGGGTVSGTIANVDSIANAVNFVIGSESDLDVAFMDGQLDEIKLFRYELTEQQIRNDYAGGAVRFE
ncbi:MAG TPA: LamG domain-containing protein [Patescibacteria group bacterium]|nr:LamG domain-containing protein [Patescibacteria group bacterium]